MTDSTYRGPDPMYVRTLEADGGGTFADDPDWSDPTIAEPDSGTWATMQFRRGNVAPLTSMLIYFAFTDANGRQVEGGTCSYEIFAMLPRPSFGLGQPEGLDGKRMYFVIGELTSADYDMRVPLSCNVTKFEVMGIRLSSITPPANATHLHIAVQELS